MHYVKTKSYGRVLAAGSAVLAVAGTLLWSPPAAATNCYTEYWNTSSPWVVKPNADGISSGTVLATATTITRTVATTPTQTGGTFSYLAYRPAGQSYESIHNTEAVSGMAGVGLRIKWAGITSPGGFKSLDALPNGTVIPNALGDLVSGAYSMMNNAEYTVTFALELVVTDAAAYKGGSVNIDQSGTLMLLPRMEPNVGSTSNTACHTGTLYPSFPPESLRAISLPIPPAPTCEFDTATLNQTVTLGAANSASVAKNGAARSAGATGEKPFFIQAKNCGAGTIFHAYFTDALAASSTNDYLRPAGASNVGIRIYHDNDTTPVPLGPAPIGSTLPARAPITTGSVNAAQGANYSLPFTAQYVQLPDASGSASPGEMSASAKLTIVYP